MKKGKYSAPLLQQFIEISACAGTHFPN